jgi:hypothetical protein
MKVKELIEKLQARDPEQDVVVAVKAYTRVYPNCYKAPWGVEATDGGYTTTIEVTLDEGFIISDHRTKTDRLISATGTTK